ncbi:DUF4825 domain-containing protein [uncultured Clostridium sp.]|uniref:DUF4825 domain-containing protein n=1 Tax=uncultured Clostridium sp. TaxID=59620 RepID=UPI00258DC5CF|nr:DUF4825 domain-containing protein [uncultured Clostridium sp.]
MKNLIKILSATIVALVLIGCNNENISVNNKSEEITKIDMEKLSSLSGSLVGNNSDMIKLVNNLPGNIYFDKLELYTEKEPYGMKVTYSKNGISDKKINEFIKDYKDLSYKNAREMFILVSNLGYVEFDFSYLGGEVLNFKKNEFVSEKCEW